MTNELIRKSDVLEIVSGSACYGNYAYIDEICDQIENMPPVNAVELPCKVGDTLYEPCKRCNCLHEYEVLHFRIIQDNDWTDNVVVGAGRELFFSEVGARAFLSRSEAEAALREMKGEAK